MLYVLVGGIKVETNSLQVIDTEYKYVIAGCKEYHLAQYQEALLMLIT